MTDSKALREALKEEIFLYERSIRQKLLGNRTISHKSVSTGSIEERISKFDPTKIAKKTEAQKKRKRKFPTERPPGSIDNANIESKKFIIWRNSQEKFFDQSFKVGCDDNFEYSVKHNGEKIVLNQNSTFIEYKGEKIMGVPSFFPKLKEMPNQSLFDNLAKAMSFVENKKKPPPAPQWKPSFHGKIDKSLVRSKKGAGDYNGSQIHHDMQWAEKSFLEVETKYIEKQITFEKAKAEMRELLSPDPKSRTGYSIKIADKSQRVLIVLAGGTHDFNSPLYFANHPRGIHPETGRKEKFGIPKTGEGGREWFDKFRPNFWREYYRRESYIAAEEINRRIKTKIISPEEAIKMWRIAHEKLEKSYHELLRLKQIENNENCTKEVKSSKKQKTTNILLLESSTIDSNMKNTTNNIFNTMLEKSIDKAISTGASAINIVNISPYNNQRFPSEVINQIKEKYPNIKINTSRTKKLEQSFKSISPVDDIIVSIKSFDTDGIIKHAVKLGKRVVSYSPYTNKLYSFNKQQIQNNKSNIKKSSGFEI